MSDVLANPKLCKNCGAPGCEFKCPCEQGYYCSTECQKDDWQDHQKQCSGQPATDIKDAKKEDGSMTREEGAYIDAGCSYLNQGQYNTAELYFVEARRICTRAYGAGDYDVGRACEGLGMTYSRSGRQGIMLLEEALGIFRSTKGERSLEAGRCLSNIGEVLYGQDKLDEALARLEEALDICTEAGGSKHRSVISVLTNMGNCYYKMGRLDEALAKHKRSLVIKRIVDGDGHESVACSLNNIGGVFCEKGMFDEARAKYEEALEIYRRVRGERHPDVATARKNIAVVLRRQKKHDEALKENPYSGLQHHATRPGPG